MNHTNPIALRDAAETIKSLIPDVVSHSQLSNADLCRLTGLSEKDLADLTVHENSEPYIAYLVQDARGSSWAWGKSRPLTLNYLLTLRKVDSEEAALLKIPLDRQEEVYRALRSKSPKDWCRFVKSLPPEFTIAVFPYYWDGWKALWQTHDESFAERAILAALKTQLQNGISSILDAFALTERLFATQPFLGPQKFEKILCELDLPPDVRKAHAARTRPSVQGILNGIPWPEKSNFFGFLFDPGFGVVNEEVPPSAIRPEPDPDIFWEDEIESWVLFPEGIED